MLTLGNLVLPFAKNRLLIKSTIWSLPKIVLQFNLFLPFAKIKLQSRNPVSPLAEAGFFYLVINKQSYKLTFLVLSS